MNIKPIFFAALFSLTACSAEVTLKDIQRNHNLATHINGSTKLMEAECEMASRATAAFVAYQTFRHDRRSFLVTGLNQSGEKRNYIVGDGFFLIDKDFVHQSSVVELANSLIQITKSSSNEERFNNG